MHVSLFDALTGRFGDATPVEHTPRSHQQLRSVISNLNRLFNAQRTAVSHLPAYGLPAISDVYRDMPASISGLRYAVKEAIEQYEPRLKRVRVVHHRTDEFAMRLVFIVSGQLVGRSERVYLQTTFRSDEVARVQTWPR